MTKKTRYAVKQREKKEQEKKDFTFFYQHQSLIPQKKFWSHCHSGYEIIFFISGSGTYQIEERTYLLKKYDLIITRPGNYHNIDINTNEMYDRYDILVNSSPQLTPLLDSLLEKFEVINCTDNPNIINCFKKMDSYKKHLPEDDFNLILNNLLIEVCYNLVINESLVHQEYIPTSKLIEKALEYINKNLFTIKDVKEVCDYIFISENHFFRLFKQEMKISPKKYITSKRLLYAQKLLQNGEHPTEIYEKCGFNNYISFYQRYVDFFGYSPSEEKIKD